jgi:hypothetical protein
MPTNSNVRTIKVDGTIIGYVCMDTMTFIPTNEVNVAAEQGTVFGKTE